MDTNDKIRLHPHPPTVIDSDSPLLKPRRSLEQRRLENSDKVGINKMRVPGANPIEKEGSCEEAHPDSLLKAKYSLLNEVGCKELSRLNLEKPAISLDSKGTLSQSRQ
jgi:hypothetical protein